eukprot:97199-Amphidinium_carterae.1
MEPDRAKAFGSRVVAQGVKHPCPNLTSGKGKSAKAGTIEQSGWVPESETKHGTRFTSFGAATPVSPP